MKWLPDSTYKNAPKAVAELAHQLESKFNDEPMLRDQKDKNSVIPWTFKAYAKLAPPQKREWDALFGEEDTGPQEATDKADEDALEEETEVAERPFGFGAYIQDFDGWGL